jgi:hypothetical protein
LDPPKIDGDESADFITTSAASFWWPAAKPCIGVALRDPGLHRAWYYERDTLLFVTVTVIAADLYYEGERKSYTLRTPA